MNRTDIHRPADFDPEQYEWVDGFDNQPEPGSYVSLSEPQTFAMDDGTQQVGTNYANAHDRWLRGLVERSTTARYGDCFQCDHCGARIRYVGVFRHRPTGDHIAVGETCADGRFTYSKATFDRLRKQAQLARKTQRLLTAWTEYRETHPADWDALAAAANPFIQNVLAKGRRYGDISDRQLAAIVSALAREVQEAEEPEEVAAATIPVPEGAAILLEGTVLATKVQDGYYGSTLKMLVEVETPDGGYRVWGTIPSSLDARRGSRVRFTANLVRSNDDESFGFFSRPRKATLLEELVPC